MSTVRQRRWGSYAILIATCLVVGVPVLADLAGDPLRRPFGYLAADAFYYLTVARNIVLRGSVSMDGVHPTNGFHPLWQLAAAMSYGVARLFRHPGHALFALAVANLAFVVGAVWLLGQTLIRIQRSLTVLFLGLPFGLYALFVLPAWTVPLGKLGAIGGAEGPLPLYGTLYSFVNGMESGLALFAFALAARLLTRHMASRSLKRGLQCGGALAFLALARLDHAALVLVPLGAWALLILRNPRRRRFAVGAVVAAIGPLALYLLVNVCYAGTAVPVSGAAKATFPVPQTYVIDGAAEFLRSPWSDHHLLALYRSAPETLSILATMFYLCIVLRVQLKGRPRGLRLRPFATRLDAFLVMMSPGILALDAYDILYVSGIGHWYFPVVTLCISLQFLSLWNALWTAWRRASAGRRVPPALRSSWWRAASGLGIAALTVLGFYRYQRVLPYHRLYSDFCYQIAPRVRLALHDAVPNLLEMDDGVIGYCLDVPAMSGMALALDKEAFVAWRERRLLEVAVGRGFGAVATLFYAPHDVTLTSAPGAVTRWLGYMEVGLPAGYQARVLYGDTEFTIVTVTGPPR
jgi:hypothetical protein